MHSAWRRVATETRKMTLRSCRCVRVFLMSICSGRALALAVFLSTTIGCGDTAAARNAPVRSPGLDFHDQPPTTSDGSVVGADNKPVEDHLDEQPTKLKLPPSTNSSAK